jgi:hypothetical protein
MLCVFLLSSMVTPLREGLVWFALVAGVGSVYVFHFEFGRLMGFLKTHYPDQHAELKSKHFIEVLAFVHPSFIRKLWEPFQSPPLPYEYALRACRAAWLVAAVTLTILLIFANTL